MIERIVGAGPSERLREELRDPTLRERELLESLKSQEREKSPEHIELITCGVEVVNQIRKDLGFAEVDVPLEHIHLVPKDSDLLAGRTGFYHVKSGHIVLSDDPSRTVFLKRLIHELIHKTLYQALQIVDDTLDWYRTGVEVVKRDNFDESLLTSLNEAITEELTKKYINTLRVFEHPLLAEEQQEMKAIIDANPHVLADLPSHVPSTEVYLLEKTATGIRNPYYTYVQYRRAVGHLITRLYEEHSDEYGSREDVERIFNRAAFTGNLLEIGKLIDRTFGKGTFRRLAELEDTAASVEPFMDSLAARKKDNAEV